MEEEEEEEELGSTSEEEEDEETHLGPVWLEKRLSVLLFRLVNGVSVALALEVQLMVLEPKELEDRDLARLSELTFFVLLVAVLLQSEFSESL